MSREPSDLLRELGRGAPTERLRARLRADISAEHRRLARRRRRRRWALPVAAVVLVAAALGVRWRSSVDDPFTVAVLEEMDAGSPLLRAQAARRSTQRSELPRSVRAQLESLLRSDPDANVRLAALHALAARDPEPAARQALLQAAAVERSPIVQAYIVSFLDTGSGGLTPTERAFLLALDHLDEAARSRLHGS